MYIKQIIKVCVFSALLVVSAQCFAQHTMNVSSHTAVIAGNTFDYSIGEMTLISTAHTGGLIVTQGFLQPLQNERVETHMAEPSSAQTMANQVKVYPNPTENILFIESIEETEQMIGYQLFDATGKVVLNEKINWHVGFNKLTLDLRNYAAGAYYLMISQPNQQGNLENTSYKIQKTN